MLWSTRLGALLLLSPFLAWGQSGADPHILAATQLYKNLEYERALVLLKRAKSVSSGAQDDAIIATIEGVVLFDMSKKDEALAAFREALYLSPDMVIPLSVSPKITEAFERTRATVKKELAPILEKRKAEELAKKQAEELAKNQAEDLRKKQADELAKRQAEDSAKKQTEELAKRQAEDSAKRQAQERRELEALARRQADLSRQQAEELERAREQEARRAAEEKARGDRPTNTRLTADPAPEGPAVSAVRARPLPVAPIILGGVTFAAAAVGTVFALLANQQLELVRKATFQSDVVTALGRAGQDALVANIAFGAAGVAGVTALISLIAHLASPPGPEAPR
jgi:hypothetical protein